MNKPNLEQNHPAEIYGLDESISTETQLLAIYQKADAEFATTRNITIGNKREQRKELLNPNERYLEVVVKRSAYESFWERKAETQVEFEQWI